MKKVLLFVFMMLVLVPVHGLEKDSNVVRKYKYYRLNEVLGPMVLKNEANEEFPLIDEDRYIEGELSALSINKPLEQDGRKIYEYDGFHYLKMLKVNTVEIKVDKGYMLSDVSIESTNGKIDYESDSDSNILTSEKSVTFKLKENVELNDLIIKCKGASKTDKFLFTILFKHDNQTLSILGANSYLDNIVIYGNQSPIKNDVYEDIYSLEELDTKGLIYKGTVKLYQYQDYKYQSYKLEREYYDEYLSEPFEDYIYRDDDDYIDVIEDNLIEETIKNESSGLEKINAFIDEQIEVEQTSNDVKENKESISLPPKNNVIKSLSDKPNVQLPVQYENALKIDNKTSANQVNDKNVYYYFILVILVVLLLIALKIKNKLKECYRW